jgi:hypothetical protein
MIARIFLINKFGAAALPTQVCFVFGHTFRIRRPFGTASNPKVVTARQDWRAELCDAGLEELAPPFALFGQIRRGRRSFDPIHVPWSINSDVC